MSNNPLPSVAGRMEMTHETFQNACQVELGRLQEDLNCDTRLVYLLCEAVRCSRECCELAQIRSDVSKAEARNKPCPKCGSRMQVSYGEPDNKEIVPPHWWCRHCGHEEDKP